VLLRGKQLFFLLQLEQFRADFEAEKKAKEEEKTRANKLSEDLQQVHRRNQQLQEEVELLRGQNSTAPRAPPSSSSNSHTSVSFFFYSFNSTNSYNNLIDIQL